MDQKRSASRDGVRLATVLFALMMSLVAAGCGIFKPGGDEIGDGLLTEGGWDPFANNPGGTQRLEDGPVDPGDDPLAFDPNQDPLTFDPAGGELDQPIGTVAGERPDGGVGKQAEELFKKGDYQRALTEAESLRRKTAPNSPGRDVADFVAGASQYYLGKFERAQVLLDAHVEKFKRSRHRESALYYQASNRVRLREWRIAGALLDGFIASYPESLLMEFALFDRAMCHARLGESEACQRMVERLEREYIYSKVRDRALALKGDVLQESNRLAEAQASYEKARKAASELGHSELEARCLANLISVAAARGQHTTAVKYHQAFFKQYAGSQYATKAALGAMPSLKATGSVDSGLESLKRILQKMPQSTEAAVMNDILVTYAKYYGEAHGAEDLLRQLGDLSSATEGSKRLKEQLVIARLEALETYFPERHGEIRVFYREMRSRFTPADLSTANVLKVADHIAVKQPDQAIPWYEEALARGGSRHSARATLGLANVLAMVGADEEAEAGFKKVLEVFGSPELAEEATLGIARVARKKEDWSASAYYWTRYLDQQGWTKARDEARKGLEESKANGGVATAPKSQQTPAAKPVATGPVAQGLAMAEALALDGKKEAAYETLGKMLQRYQSTEGLEKSSVVRLRKAQTMHEDLGIELGK